MSGPLLNKTSQRHNSGTSGLLQTFDQLRGDCFRASGTLIHSSRHVQVQIFYGRCAEIPAQLVFTAQSRATSVLLSKHVPMLKGYFVHAPPNFCLSFWSHTCHDQIFYFIRTPVPPRKATTAVLEAVLLCSIFLTVLFLPPPFPRQCLLAGGSRKRSGIWTVRTHVQYRTHAGEGRRR